ncbi:hypothetical protein Hanom_Chr12g01139561 [Helianthus anomalus]
MNLLETMFNLKSNNQCYPFFPSISVNKLSPFETNPFWHKPETISSNVEGLGTNPFTTISFKRSKASETSPALTILEIIISYASEFITPPFPLTCLKKSRAIPSSPR